MITTVGEKLVHTKTEWKNFLEKLHALGYIWCDSDSLLTPYEPDSDFPLYIRILDNKMVYWSRPDEPSKTFNWDEQ